MFTRHHGSPSFLAPVVYGTATDTGSGVTLHALSGVIEISTVNTNTTMTNNYIKPTNANILVTSEDPDALANERVAVEITDRANGTIVLKTSSIASGKKYRFVIFS